MKVVYIEPITVSYHRVTTDEGLEYERYSADNWRWVIGESTETVSFPDKLESSFQLLNQTSDRRTE